MKRFYKFLMPLVAIVAMALPWNARAQVTVNIGDGGTTTNSYLPMYTLYNNTLSEQIYTASEIGMPGLITSIAFYNGGSEKTPNVKIYMINTTESSFSSTTAWLPVTASDLVFDGTVTFAAGQWTTITLDNPFMYDGASNLGLIFDGNMSWSSGLACRVFSSTSNCAMYVYSDGTDYNAVGATYSASSRLSEKNQLQLGIMPADMDCYPVRNITASNIGPWSCTLSWSDTNNAGASYVVISLPDSTVLASGISDTTVDLTNLLSDHAYTFGVYADCGGDGESMVVNTNVHTLVSCPPPTGLTVDSLTASDVTIHWTPGFEETEWYLSIGDSLIGSVTDTFYTISDLNANTVYTIYLRAVCDVDDSSVAISTSVHTLAGDPISVFPYTCGFEVTDDGDEAADWILENGSQTNKWFVGAPGAHNGTNGLFISNDNGTSNAYTTSSISHAYAYAVFNFSEVGEYMISYDWKNQGESNSYDWLRVFMAPASQDFVAGSAQPLGTSTYSACTTAVAPGWFELTGRTTSPYTLAQSSTWQNVGTTFTITNPGTYKLVFMWSNDGSGGSNPPASVDNISISLNTCPAPVDLTIDSLMPTAIDVHWTSIGEESEWALQVGDSLITGIADTFYTITGLEQYTLYTMRVYAVCDAEDTSLASPSVTGRTTVSCPWPVSVTATATGGDTVSVTWTAGAGSSATDYYLVYGPTGFNPATVGEGNWINVPGATNYEITGLTAGLWDIYVRADCGSDDGISAWAGPASVGLGYMNIDQVDTLHTCGVIICDDGGPMGDYGTNRNDQVVIYPIDDQHGITVGGTSYTEGSWDWVTIYEGVGTSGTILFQDNTSGVTSQLTVGPFDVEGPITITFTSDGSVVEPGFQISVTCYDLSGCVRPNNLVCNSTTPDSVAISWNGSGASSWEVFAGPAGAVPNADSAFAVTDSSYVFTTLNAGVTYDIYVRSDCGGDYSDWRGPLTVTPGTYVIGTSGSASISMCGGVIYDDGGATGQYSNSADFVLTVHPSHPDSMLTFQGWAYTESSIDYLRIYEGTSPSGTILWQTSTSSQLDNIPYTIVTSGPITLKWHTDGSVVYDGFELQIGCMAAPECSPVDNLTVHPTPTAALVTWQPGYYGNYTGADIEYKADTADTWISLPAVTGTYAVITGLDPLTDYNVRVTTDCDGFPGGVATANFTTKQFPCEVEDTTLSATGTIGTGTSETTGVPVNSSWGNTMCQSIYLASELTALGMGNTITAITYTWTNNSSYAKEFSIYMTNTSASEFTGSSTSNWMPTGASALVYNGPHPTGTSGSVTYQLTTPFVWDGSSNICITTTMNQPAGASHTSSGFYGKSTETSPQAYRSMYKYQDSNPIDGSNPASVSPSSRSYYRPNITLVSSGCSQYGTCAAPAVAVVDVTTNTATLAWAPGNTETSWNLYYRMAGDATWSAPIAVTGNNYIVTGLNQGRHYEFKLESTCSGDTYATTADATLLCAQISSLPFTENFNGWGTGVTPNCWSNQAGYSPTSYGIISSSYNCSGSTGGSIYMYSSSGNYVTYLALPELDTTVYQPNQLQLVFNLFYNSTSYSAPQVEVGVMTSQDNAGSFVPVDTVTHSGALSTWEVFEVPLTNYTGNGSYVAIRTNYPGTYSYFYLDDVTLEVIPTCPRPDSLTASGATTNSVDLAWNERGSASNWVIEYGPRGFQLGTGTTVTASSNPFTLTGLPVAYQGEYYVKSVCGAGDTGEYSRRSCAFGTTQIPATLPYNYDFENVAEWNNWQNSTNHATANWYRGTDVADSGSYSMYVANSDTGYFDYSFSAVVNAAVYRDIDFGPVDSSYTLSFRARVGGTTTNSYDGLMVFLVDPAVAPVASQSNITSPWGNVNNLYRIASVRLDTTWQTYTASFDTISGVQRVAFFWFNQNTGASYDNIPQAAAVDNIHIDYSSCVRPVDLEATFVGSTTATLTWTGAAGANYEVTYREVGGTNMTAMATTNSITLTGLESNTTYRAWVRKICGAGDTSLYCDGTEFMTTMCDGGTEVLNYDPSTSATTSSYSPIGYATYNYSYVQTIIDSADLASLGGDITAFGFMPTNTTSSDYYTNMTMYMANVSESDLSSGFIHPDATHIFHKVIDSANFNFTNANEWQIHNLDSAFTWDGHSNLLIAVNREHGTWTSSGSFSAHAATASKMRYIYQDSGPYDINTVSDGTASSTVGDIRLISCGGTITCNAPDIDTAIVGETEVTLQWTGSAASYEVAAMEGTWSEPIIGEPATGNTATITGLTPATTYTVGVRGVCGEGRYSDWTVTTITTEAHPCYAPTNVTATNPTFDGATIAWTVGEEGQSNFELHITAAGVDTLVATTSNPVTVTGLPSATAYTVTVRAVCGEGDYSEWSAPATFSTATCQMAEGVRASATTATTATITWTANGSSSYEVAYGITGTSRENCRRLTANTNSITINGLDEATAYDVYVRSVCAAGVTSDWSDVVTFETQDVAIDDVDNASISLYPNPASSTVTLTGIEGDATVTVVDMNGRESGKWKVESGKLTIDVTGYAQGAYFVRITGDRVNAIRKLIVR